MMTNYEASKRAERIAVAKHPNAGWVVFYADERGRCLGQAYEGASIGAAVRALENSADEDGTHPEDAEWRARVSDWKHNAPLNPEFRGAARPRAGEDY
jgi:hypothetical protein